eukprot:jgi/Mesvir1/7345/Mv19153-RA.1
MKDNLAQLVNRASYETIFTLLGKRLDDEFRAKEKQANEMQRSDRVDAWNQKRARGSQNQGDDEGKEETCEHFDVSRIVDAKMVNKTVFLLVDWFYTDEDHEEANRLGKPLKQNDWLPISNFEPGCDELVHKFANNFIGTHSKDVSKKFHTNHVAVRSAWQTVLKKKLGQARGSNEARERSHEPEPKRAKTEDRTPPTFPSNLREKPQANPGPFQDPHQAAMAIGMKLKASERKQQEIMAELEALRAEKEANAAREELTYLLQAGWSGPIMTFSTPVFNPEKKLVAVIGGNFLLQRLSTFLAGLPLRGGDMFVMMANGQFVASSHEESLVRNASTITVFDTSDKYIRAAAQVVSEQLLDERAFCLKHPTDPCCANADSWQVPAVATNNIIKVNRNTTNPPAPLVLDFVAWLRAKPGPIHRVASLGQAGSTYISVLLLEVDSGLSMVAVLLIPRGKIMGDIDDTSNKTLLVIILVALATAAIGSVVSLTLTRTVKKEVELGQELELMNLQLQEMKHRAEVSNETKSAFLANISHEIRTPMTSILGCVDLLLMDPLLGSARGSVEIIKRASTMLLNILNSLLDLAKIDSGKMELEEDSVDLWGMLSSLVDMYSVNVGKRQIDVILDLADNVPHVVRGDVTRIQQILNNLCSNALKFTFAGHVAVRARVLNPDSIADRETYAQIAAFRRRPATGGPGSRDFFGRGSRWKSPRGQRTAICSESTSTLVPPLPPPALKGRDGPPGVSLPAPKNSYAKDVAHGREATGVCVEEGQDGCEFHTLLSRSFKTVGAMGKLLLRLSSGSFQKRVEMTTEPSDDEDSTSASLDSPTHLWLEFEVDDSGLGIPRNKWEAVFDDFNQADTSTTRIYGGTGLGLSIVRRLVRLMKGDIIIVAKEDPGTLFRFWIQLRRCDCRTHKLPIAESSLVSPRELVQGNGMPGSSSSFTGTAFRLLSSMSSVDSDKNSTGTSTSDFLTQRLEQLRNHSRRNSYTQLPDGSFSRSRFCGMAGCAAPQCNARPTPRCQLSRPILLCMRAGMARDVTAAWVRRMGAPVLVADTLDALVRLAKEEGGLGGGEIHHILSQSAPPSGSTSGLPSDPTCRPAHVYIDMTGAIQDGGLPSAIQNRCLHAAFPSSSCPLHGHPPPPPSTSAPPSESGAPSGRQVAPNASSGFIVVVEEAVLMRVAGTLPSAEALMSTVSVGLISMARQLQASGAAFGGASASAGAGHTVGGGCAGGGGAPGGNKQGSPLGDSPRSRRVSGDDGAVVPAGSCEVPVTADARGARNPLPDPATQFTPPASGSPRGPSSPLSRCTTATTITIGTSDAFLGHHHQIRANVLLDPEEPNKGLGQPRPAQVAAASSSFQGDMGEGLRQAVVELAVRVARDASTTHGPHTSMDLDVGVGGPGPSHLRPTLSCDPFLAMQADGLEPSSRPASSGGIPGPLSLQARELRRRTHSGPVGIRGGWRPGHLAEPARGAGSPGCIAGGGDGGGYVGGASRRQSHASGNADYVQTWSPLDDVKDRMDNVGISLVLLASCSGGGRAVADAPFDDLALHSAARRVSTLVYMPLHRLRLQEALQDVEAEIFGPDDQTSSTSEPANISPMQGPPEEPDHVLMLRRVLQQEMGRASLAGEGGKKDGLLKRSAGRLASPTGVAPGCKDLVVEAEGVGDSSRDTRGDERKLAALASASPATRSMPTVARIPAPSFEASPGLSGASVRVSAADAAVVADIGAAGIADISTAAKEEGPIVLLVEDTEINQRIFKKMLQSMGVDVDVASDGMEAVEAWKKKYYDLVLMDCQLPVLDGYEATMAIRELEAQRGGMARPTPIVALTADAMLTNRRRCEEAGMTSFLTKLSVNSYCKFIACGSTASDLGHRCI